MDWNEYNPNLFMMGNTRRASLVPAVAVILAPTAYIEVGAFMTAKKEFDDLETKTQVRP